MNTAYSVLLAMSCASSLLLVLASPLSEGLLELGIGARGSVHGLAPRERRHAFPGMQCLTIGFLQNLKGRFVSFIDPNDDGHAIRPEVHEFLKIFNPNVSDSQIDGFIARRDQNGNGIIEFVPEYVQDMATPDLTLEAASEWFGLEDNDGDGYVTRQELMGVAMRMGMTLEQAADHVLTLYMREDANGDERLSFDEYKSIYGQ